MTVLPDLDIALVYARHLSAKFHGTEYGVFDLRVNDHVHHYYLNGGHSNASHFPTN